MLCALVVLRRAFTAKRQVFFSAAGRSDFFLATACTLSCELSFPRPKSAFLCVPSLIESNPLWPILATTRQGNKKASHLCAASVIRSILIRFYRRDQPFFLSVWGDYQEFNIFQIFERLNSKVPQLEIKLSPQRPPWLKPCLWRIPPKIWASHFHMASSNKYTWIARRRKVLVWTMNSGVLRPLHSPPGNEIKRTRHR